MTRPAPRQRARIPAGFTGLVGLKGTYGRIPRGPRLELGNMMTSTGCMARSVRDTARWFDVTNGHDPRDPSSLPRVGGWGDAVVSPVMWELLEETALDLIAGVGQSPLAAHVSVSSGRAA